MKKFIVVILSLVLVLSLVACGGSDVDQPDETNVPEESAVTPPSEVIAPAVDLSNVDTEITFGDYAAMEDFQKKLGNFEAENQVVKIDGLCSKLGSTYSIMEDDGNGNRLGVSLIVDGWTDADYPADYTRVQILGVVVTEGWSHSISVLPENITIIPEN
ncbi:MAG: hypothetical protein CW335_05280 [Clostridiales bacterium]|nr:hypothetical protein [Clostridiales bacterium]